MKNKKVLVAMSGGVDSSVATFLLKQEGYEVAGVFMKVWDDNSPIGTACFSPDGSDINDVTRVAEQLNVELTIIDLSQEYKRFVLDYFIQEYSKGRTPNPCVVCNKFLKFGFLIEKSIKKGLVFDFFATGHYSLVEYSNQEKKYFLKKGQDANKDQSYFLFLLTQKQLSKLIFPLGSLTKKDVCSIAHQQGFFVKDKEESQDFISGDKSLFFENGSAKGDVVDTKGNTLGQHKGIIYYTIGQRKGLGISGGKPLYVVKIDAENNRVVLGEEKELYKKEFLVSSLHFTALKDFILPFECEVKIRYRHPAVQAVVYPLENNVAKVVYKTPQKSITPGQAAVFYNKDLLIGGGFIEKIL